MSNANTYRINLPDGTTEDFTSKKALTHVVVFRSTEGAGADGRVWFRRESSRYELALKAADKVSAQSDALDVTIVELETV